MQAELVALVRRPPMRVNIRYKVYPMVGTRSARSGVAHFDAFSQLGTVGTRGTPARSAAARPMIVSGAAPPRVDTLQRVRRGPVPAPLSPFLPCALASADGIGPVPLLRLL